MGFYYGILSPPPLPPLPLAHKVDHTVKTFNGSVDVQKVRVTPMDALAFDDGVKIHWTV